MELRGKPVSVHNARRNFAGRAHRDCEVALPPIAPAISRLAMPGTQRHFPTGIKASWRSQSPYLRVACANSLLCGPVSLGGGHLLSLGKKLSSREDKVIDRVF